MDKFEHDRRVVEFLGWLDSVVGPLATLRNATKNRLDVQLTSVPRTVRTELIRPRLSNSDISYTMRHTPQYEMVQCRDHQSEVIREYRKVADTLWVIRFNMKALSPSNVYYSERDIDPETYEFKKSLSFGGRYSTTRPSTVCFHDLIKHRRLSAAPSGRLTVAHLVAILEKTLDHLKEGKPCLEYNSFQGIS